MKSNSLALSILNGQVRGVFLRRGAVQGAYDGPDSLADLTGLTPVLREASAKTGSDAKQLTIVIADPRLSDQLVEVPQVRGGMLTRLLERQAQRVKAFPADAVWSSQAALPTKNANAALLHLCPRPVRDQLLRNAREAQLELVRVLPTTAVLIAHLKSLPIQKDEVAVLAAESGRSITIVVGRKDGRVALGRVLSHTWVNAPERVITDLTRSMAFAEQQSGLPITSVWLFGEGAEAQLQSLQQQIKVPVKLSPVPYSPYYWAEQGSTIPEKDDGNLISEGLRKAPQQARFLTVTTMLVALLLLGAVSIAGIFEFLRGGQLKEIAALNERISELNVQKTDMLKLVAEMERMQEAVRVLDETKLPPAPLWLFGYLGQIMPDELAATQLRLDRTNDLWQVQLAGVAQGGTNALRSLNTLSNSLANSSFRMAVERCGLGSMELKTTLGAIAARSDTAQQMLRRSNEPRSTNTFVLQGVFR